jgi:glycosyltransferase
MKISIITVTFNSAATIADTLDSVAAQRHPDIEHIVIDGGSTDGTQTILAERGSRIARWISEPDGGIYDAMNKGLRLATGEYVGFLNGDDALASPDALALIAAAATNRPDAVFGDLVYVAPSQRSPLVRYWRAGEFSRGALRRGWMPPHPTLYIHRRAIERVGSFDSRLRIAADYDYMLRLFADPQARMIYVPSVLVRMRIGGASNRSLRALIRKSREDLLVLRRHRVGGVMTLLCKNVRKLPQFFSTVAPAEASGGQAQRSP